MLFPLGFSELTWSRRGRRSRSSHPYSPDTTFVHHHCAHPGYFQTLSSKLLWFFFFCPNNNLCSVCQKFVCETERDGGLSVCLHRTAWDCWTPVWMPDAGNYGNGVRKRIARDDRWNSKCVLRANGLSGIFLLTLCSPPATSLVLRHCLCSRESATSMCLLPCPLSLIFPSYFHFSCTADLIL